MYLHYWGFFLKICSASMCRTIFH